ncbi:EXS-domain-containing protein [Hygrophoropsis aurantiaca]|uniref:EXS-domain-containing protein n=1 Tax=Hygrophoropsis aurantiaca TaxID=72124 RepID=A0ACB8AIS8_9AGAM|nr:EXS-domain-containing protein [Hygrophoropsis aurantiaca]
MWGRTRWWTIKNVAKLGGSGFWTVEFTDFWLGDQFCSLVYTLSNLYFVGCFYTRYFPSPPSFATSAPTPTNNNWGIYFVLGTLPFLARFVQSIRRYYDSRLSTHLINAGKYGMGLIYYFFYYYWRHQGNLDRGPSVVVWCLTATIYALYACAWDFLMDWSICKPHARYPLLRPELVYTTQIPMYYFALISNLLIRFIWVLYIPERGPNLTLRTFIAALLEMLRRIQWNFYRLENEHLGNMDQYRVTREVPLPYHFDTGNSNGEDEDDEVDGDEDAVGTSWLRRQLTRDSKKMSQEMEET